MAKHYGYKALDSNFKEIESGILNNHSLEKTISIVKEMVKRDKYYSKVRVVDIFEYTYSRNGKSLKSVTKVDEIRF